MRIQSGLFLFLFTITIFGFSGLNAAKGELPQVDNPPFPATNFRDGTESYLKSLKDQGITLIEQRQVRNITLKLYIHPSAQAFIASNSFLVKEDNYSQQDLNKFIFEQFEGSIKFFVSLNPVPNFNELHLVLINYGDMGTISSAMQNTRVLDLHIGRWHKSMKTKNEIPTQISSVHEFAHVVNYMYAPNQTKFNREFIAVLVELLYLKKLYGDDYLQENYLAKFTRPIEPMTLIDSEKYTNMNVVRAMAMALNYAFNGISIQGPLEFGNFWHYPKDLVLQMLRSQVKDKELINDACAKLQWKFFLKWKEQNIFEWYNYEHLKADTKEMFVRFPVNYQN